MADYLDKAGVTYLIGKIKTMLSGKVDIIAEKGLSTNDYTTTEKDKLAGIAVGATNNTVDSALSDTSTNALQNKSIKAALDLKASLANLSGKVDIIAGKGLSTNDYTTTEKDKLAGIADGATNNTVDIALSDTSTNALQNKIIKAALDLKAPLANPGFTGVPTAPTASAGVSTTQLATTQFVAQAVSQVLAAGDAMVFKGTIGTAGTVTALPTTYNIGWTYRVITAGTYAGQVCEVGDLITAIMGRSGSGNLNTDWTVMQTNINGALTDVQTTAPLTVSGTGSTRTIGLAASGIAAGTYRSVTIDAYGRATAGSNPTTLAGYGITDALKTTDLVAITNSEIDAMFV